MCGIVGSFRISPERSAPISTEVANNMVRSIWRRGPDGEGQWRSQDGLCWLGHRRLSVIDIEMGHQPMSNEDMTIWVVFNGEIYNYRTLRKELGDCGHKFKTNSDTEVLVHGYEEWGGENLVRKLQGIFAFGIYDSKARTVFIARDHMGVKPLHWWTDGNVFLFGSEIKSFLCHPLLKEKRVNTAGVAQFLVTRYVSRPNTIFEGINRLPEASCMEVRLHCRQQQLEPLSYWDMKFVNDKPTGDMGDLLEQLDILLKETVSAQLMSDVPLGAQLSGGVDSSIVVAMMELLRQESGGGAPVKTFSVGFDVEKFNEFKYASQIAERYKTDHHEIHVGFRDFVETLPLLCWIYDEPLGESQGIPTYLMCKKAKEDVTVMLCGEGADEQFGGYRKYIFDQLSCYVDWLPVNVRMHALRGAGSLMPFKARRMRSILEILAMKDKGSRFASWYGAFDKVVQSTLLDPELRARVSDLFIKQVFNELISNCDSQNQLDQFFYCDLHSRLVDTLLVKADRVSMGAGVEVRVPLLDHKIVEFSSRLPRKYKVKGLSTKILLKKLAERYAPYDLIYRRKVGFTMPLADWFVGPLRSLIKDVLTSERCLSRGYYRPDVLKSIVDNHLESKVDREQGIWVLLALELWHRIYVDDDGSEAAADRLKAELLSSL